MSFTLTEVARLPGPWLLLGGLLAGAALASATRGARPAQGHPDPEVVRARRWIRFSLFLSAAVVAGLAALFLPGPGRVASTKYAYFAVTATLVSGLMFRFPKTAGLTGVVLGVGLFTTLYLFSRAWTPFSGETQIGRIVVYGQRDGMAEAELEAAGRPTMHVRLPSGPVLPLVRTAVFDDLWPFLGWRRWYRVEGIERADGEIMRYPRDAGVTQVLYDLFEQFASVIPGASLVRSEAVQTQPGPELRGLEVYALMLSGDGSARVTGPFR